MLQQFIQDSLFRQRRSCLPHLGVFTLEHIPARYDVTNKTIIPPAEEIGFSENREDDGKLMEWIAQREYLTPTVAKMKMDRYLDQLKQLLKSGKPFDIPGVGQLSADNVGRITFTPASMPLELDSLSLQPVIRTDVSHKVLIGDKEMVNNQVVNHVTASSGPSVNVPAEEYEVLEEEKPSRFLWLWIAIPAVLVIGTAVFIWGIYSMNKNNAARSSAPVAPPPADTTARQAAAALDSAAQANTAPVVADSDKIIDYYVVVQTFRSVKAAETIRKKLEGHTNPPMTLMQGDSSVVRLAVRCSTRKADTTAQKETIRKEYMLKNVTIVY